MSWNYIKRLWEVNLGFNPIGLFDRWERWMIEVWYAPGTFWPIAHIAAFFDFCDVLRDELAAGTPVDHRDTLQFTPLLQAAHGDSRNAALVLLQSGADPNARTRYGYSAIRYTSRNSLDVLPELLEIGSCVNLIDEDFDQTALHENASSILWHPVVFESLTSSPSSQELINLKTPRAGDTPLHLAASISVESSATLLQQRQRASDPTYQKSTARLAMATCDLFSAQGPKAFTTLRDAWAGLGVQTPFRNTKKCFLHGVIVWKAQLIQKLLKRGADANITDHYGRLPLHRAVVSMSAEEDSFIKSYSDPTTVTILGRVTEELDRQDQAGTTPLQIALRRKLYSTIQTLIQLGAGRNTFTDVELSTVIANASKHRSENFEISPYPWSTTCRCSSIEVLGIISVLRQLSPPLPDGILSRIVDLAKVWTETEYSNTFSTHWRMERWHSHALMVTEKIVGAEPGPVREVTIQADDSSSHIGSHYFRAADLDRRRRAAGSNLHSAPLTQLGAC